MSPKRFYVAAPLSEGLVAEQICSYVTGRRLGHVASTWHLGARGEARVDPAYIHAKGAIWLQCKRELREATHLVVYTASGTPRATFVELGYFLGLAAESHSMGGVYWISPDAETCPVPVGDPLVTHCKSVAEFLEVVK